MSKKVMIEVEENALEILDNWIQGSYYTRCFHRNILNNDEWGEHEIYTNSDPIFKAKLQAYDAKKVAKAFGLYPYNQEEVKFPEIILEV